MVDKNQKFSKRGRPFPAKKTIEQVRLRYEVQLMNTDGVEGVGIGEEQGKRVIKVYVSRKTEDLVKRIPKVLENYPVVIEVTGEFRALDKVG